MTDLSTHSPWDGHAKAWISPGKWAQVFPVPPVPCAVESFLMERNGPTLTQFDERIGRNGWPGCATWRPRTHDHNRVYEAFSVCRLHPFRPLCVFNCFSGPALRLTRVSSACVRSVWFCRLVAQTRDLPGLLNPGFSRRASWPPGVSVHKRRTRARLGRTGPIRAAVFT